MTLDALIMSAGAFVAFLAVSGFPPSWYKPMFFLAGLFVVALGIVVRRREGRRLTALRLNRPDMLVERHEEEDASAQ